MEQALVEGGRFGDRGRFPSQGRFADGQCAHSHPGRWQEGLCVFGQRRSASTGAVALQPLAQENKMKSNLGFPALPIAALLFGLGAAAQSPSTAPAKTSGLNPAEATA